MPTEPSFDHGRRALLTLTNPCDLPRNESRDASGASSTPGRTTAMHWSVLSPDLLSQTQELICNGFDGIPPAYTTRSVTNRAIRSRVIQNLDGT